MRFTTESGSVYEIRTRDGHEEIRRVNPTDWKRADGEWVRLHNRFGPHVGMIAHLTVESLAPFGPDDHGTKNAGKVTARVTSPVVDITEGET